MGYAPRQNVETNQALSFGKSARSLGETRNFFFFLISKILGAQSILFVGMLTNCQVLIG